MTQGKVFDNDVELGFLSTIINNGYLIFEALQRVKPHMFGSAVNADIYRSMLSLASKGVDVDIVLLQVELADRNALEMIGGVETLEFISKCPSNTSALNEYGIRIQEAFKMRSLLTLSSAIPAALDNNTVDFVLSELNKKVGKIAASAGGADTIVIGDVGDSVLEVIAERVKNPGISGESTGFPDIDYFTGGLMEGSLWYLGARPSHGKSALLTKMFLNLGQQGVPCLLFNKEMGLQSTLERMLSAVSGVSATGIRMGKLTKREFGAIEAAKDVISKYPIYIDNNFMGDSNYISSTIRKYHQLHNIRVVGVDYIQLMVDRDEQQTHRLGQVSRQMKLLANELGLTAVILSQVNRECESRENKRPMASDLRQSGNLEEDADLMVALYRDSRYFENAPEGVDDMEFIIRKSRNGPIGTVNLQFDERTVNVYNGIDTKWS